MAKKIKVFFKCFQCNKQCEREEEMKPEEVEIISGYDDRKDCNFYFEPMGVVK